MDDKNQQRIANEIVDKILDNPDQVFVFFGQKKLRNERFFMGFQSMFEALAKDKTLSGVDTRILHYLFSACEFENYLMINQSEIAEKLDLKRQNVGRSIKKLIEGGYIEQRKVGRRNVYRINKNLIWKGKVDIREKVIPFPK